MLSLSLNTITPARKESLPGELARLSSAKDELRRLKDELTPEQKKEIIKGQVSGGAKKALNEIGSGQFLDDVSEKKRLSIPLLIGLLAYHLQPEIQEEDDKKAASKPDKLGGKVRPSRKSSKEDEVKYAEIKAKKEDEDVEYATVPPKAKPEAVLRAIETNAKNLDELYKQYKRTGDAKALRYFLFRAITAKESGLGKNNKLKLRLVNQAAVGPGTRRKLLKKYGIKVPPLRGSNYLFPKESHVATFEAFKERVFTVFKTRNAGDAAQILARCAVGKYQVLPIYWVKGVKGKKKMGEAELRVMYNYIRSPQVQQDTAMSILDSIGKKHNWNPAYVMVEYYAGARGVRLLKENNPAIYRKQYGGHGSMMAYVKRTSALADRFIVQSKKA